MHTSFGEQSIGCSASNALTPAISRYLLESSNMPDKYQLLKSPVLVGTINSAIPKSEGKPEKFFHYAQTLTFRSAARIDVYFVQERLLHLIDILVAVYLSQLLLLAVVFKYLDCLIEVDD